MFLLKSSSLLVTIAWFLTTNLTSHAIAADASESENTVSIQYRDQPICTGIQLDIDFVLTSSRCVNYTKVSDIGVLIQRENNKVWKVNSIATNFGFALLHLRAPYPSATVIDEILTATESPERGEECEVLSFNGREVR